MGIEGMGTNTQGQSRQNRKAAGYILLSVFGFSTIPLFVSWSGSGETPFLFNAGLRIGHAAGYFLFLVVFYGELISDQKILSIIWRRLFTWKWAILLTTVLTTVAYFDLGLFALSSRFIDVSITAILFESSTLFIILLMAWLFRRESRFRNITPMMLLMLSLAFARERAILQMRRWQRAQGSPSQFPASPGASVTLRGLLYLCWYPE